MSKEGECVPDDPSTWPAQPEPNRVTSDEGFEADKEPSVDTYNQRHPKNAIETYGQIPTVIIGNEFLRPSGTVKVLQEILDLPPQVRATAQKIDVGLDGELHARRATQSERGGGLRVELKADLPLETVKTLPKTHQNASFPKKIHFPEDEFMQQKSKVHKDTFRKR